MPTKTLKIAMLSVHASPLGRLGTRDTGGMSVYVQELAVALGKRGHRVDIYTRHHGGGSGKSVTLADNVRLLHVKTGNGNPEDKMALYSHLDEFFQKMDRLRWEKSLSYDIIHSHYWLSGEVGQMAQQRWLIPHMFMFHTVAAMKNGATAEEREPRLRIDAEMRLAKTCQRILVATDSEKQQLQQHYDVAAEAVDVVPCGVNLDIFRPIDKLAAREQLAFDPDEAIILYVGRFVPLKGIERLLEAVKYLQHLPWLRLVLVGGDGPDTAETRNLQRICRQLGIHQRVTFTGSLPQTDLPPYYSAADVLVLPSRYESFGLVALEALASGTPVVATRVGAMEDVLRQGETGHLVGNGSARLLASGIDSFIARRHTLSPEKIRASVQQYSWARVATAMIEQYRTVFREYHAVRN
ncbi:MAG: glycosyltransferase [Deltaproteobacteria bacterium]|nr:glycosyltransferase [Deltaproteobacteria bacterium]MBW2071127.1 glycosyltransferase [Deltaproteobacteria bacterium]